MIQKKVFFLGHLFVFLALECLLNEANALGACNIGSLESLQTIYYLISNIFKRPPGWPLKLIIRDAVAMGVEPLWFHINDLD